MLLSFRDDVLDVGVIIGGPLDWKYSLRDVV